MSWINNVGHSVRKIYRLLRYKNEWKKSFREINIKRKQNSFLHQNYLPDSKKLIVFLVPGSDWASGNVKISGGVMSIISICEETAQLEEIHNSKTIACTMNEDHLFLKFSNFKNNTTIYRFEQLAKHFGSLEELIIHIPELMVTEFQNRFRKIDLAWMNKITKIHFNIMNQSIWLMPEPQVVGSLFNFANLITITTAHQKYCTSYYRKHYNVPLHKLSVWISPEQYYFKNWEQKENLIIISPDEHPMKDEILRELERIDGLTIQIISGISYSEYKLLISKARWSLTFGEGLDGYFIEPVFSGAISFAVYNDSFFTSNFKELETVYPTWNDLQENIAMKISSLSGLNKYYLYQKRQFDICAQNYNRTNYQENIKKFYEQNYTYK